MSMKKWTDEELVSTRDKLEALNIKNKTTGSGSKLWLLTAFLGAFAVSTGFSFIFFDGVSVLNVILIVMGTVTCISWYKSEKRHKDNIAFLAEINKEIKSRKKKDDPKPKSKTDKTTTDSKEALQKEVSVIDQQEPKENTNKTEEQSKEKSV